MPKLGWKPTLVSCLLLTLTACGGGGGSTGAPAPSNPDPSTTTPDTSDPTTLADPITPPADDPPPTGDSARLYDGLGLVPASLPDGMAVDAEVAAAVARGYLAFATLMTTIDMRMSLQAYEWAVPMMVDLATAPVPEGETSQAQAVECDSGTGWVFDDTPIDGHRRIGFDFGSETDLCGPFGNSYYFYSTSVPSRQVWQQQSSGAYQYRLTNAAIQHYDGVRIGTSGLCARYSREETGTDAAMTFTNQPMGQTASVSSIRLSHADGSPLITVRGGDEGVATPSEILSHKEPPYPTDYASDPEMMFRIPYLDVHRASGTFAGAYRLTSDGFTMLYKADSENPQRPELGITAGGFSVTAPDGTVYRYQFPAGADPLAEVLYLHATVTSPDGTTAEGNIPQAFVIRRLHLAQ